MYANQLASCVCQAKRQIRINGYGLQKILSKLTLAYSVALDIFFFLFSQQRLRYYFESQHISLNGSQSDLKCGECQMGHRMTAFSSLSSDFSCCYLRDLSSRFHFPVKLFLILSPNLCWFYFNSVHNMKTLRVRFRLHPFMHLV